jgi:hypothetical protein
MKRFLVPAVSALTTVALVACVDEPPKKTQKKPGHLPPSQQTMVDPNAPPTDTQPTQPTTENTKPTAPEPKPNTNPVPDAQGSPGNLPYAKPVPGKPGFVFSPYDQYKGYIDVRGFPPGTEVKDPYSGKSFLVP